MCPFANNFIDFNVNDLSSKYFDEAEKLLPGKNYIGLSITQGNRYRKKTWKLENFIDLSKILDVLSFSKDTPS